MSPADVKAAIVEAERFIARAKQLLATDVTEWEGSALVLRKWHGGSLSAGKQTAAVRRASMDLTRALAEMRKP